MAKKNRVSELDLPPLEIIVTPMPTLPETEVVNQTVANVTGKKQVVETHKPKTVKKTTVGIDSKKTKSSNTAQKNKAKIDNTVQSAPQIMTIQKTYGRPKKVLSAEREKYTTWLHKDLIVELKYRAAKRRCSPADIMEEIIRQHIEEYWLFYLSTFVRTKVDK